MPLFQRLCISEAHVKFGENLEVISPLFAAAVNSVAPVENIILTFFPHDSAVKIILFYDL